MEGFPLVGLVDRAFISFPLPLYVSSGGLLLRPRVFACENYVPDSNKGYDNFENLLTQMQRLQKRDCK